MSSLFDVTERNPASFSGDNGKRSLLSSEFLIIIVHIMWLDAGGPGYPTRTHQPMTHIGRRQPIRACSRDDGILHKQEVNVLYTAIECGVKFFGMAAFILSPCVEWSAITDMRLERMNECNVNESISMQSEPCAHTFNALL